MSGQQTLKDALRAKFRTPREAIKALGLDEKLLDVPRMALDGKAPNRLQYLLVTRAARIFNPQLATDAQVDYGALFKGVNSSNLSGRRTTILRDAQRMLRGKTIAQDASIEALAHLLDQFEHVPKNTLDESVSEPERNAMQAAAGGQSNIGIPKEEEKEDDEEEDEMPENAMDDEDVEIEVGGENDKDEEQEAGEDADIEEEEEGEGEHQEEAEDEGEEHEDEDEQVTKGAMDEAIHAAVNAAVMAERKRNQAAYRAREFVRPYVGDLPVALDSAEEILRSAAVALNIKNAARVPAAALRTLIEVGAKPAGAQAAEHVRMAQDSIADGLDYFPEARRIVNA